MLRACRVDEACTRTYFTGRLGTPSNQSSPLEGHVGREKVPIEFLQIPLLKASC